MGFRKKTSLRNKSKSGSLISKKWKKILAIFGVSILLLLVMKTQMFQFFRNNDRFNITDIRLIHSNQIKLFDVEKLTGLMIGKNIFQYSLHDIKEKLERNIFIRQAHVSRNLPSIIEIELEERVPLVTIKGTHRWYWMDSEGVILNPLIELESVESRKVRIAHIEDFITTGYQVSSELIGPLVEVVETFHDSLLKNVIVINQMNVNHKGEIIFYDSEGLEIIVGKDNIENRLIRLLAIIQDLKRKNKKAKRIDLRFSSVPVKTID